MTRRALLFLLPTALTARHLSGKETLAEWWKRWEPWLRSYDKELCERVRLLPAHFYSDKAHAGRDFQRLDEYIARLQGLKPDPKLAELRDELKQMRWFVVDRWRNQHQ